MFTVTQAAAALGETSWRYYCSNGRCTTVAVTPAEARQDDYGVWCPGCGNSLRSLAPNTQPDLTVFRDPGQFCDLPYLLPDPFSESGWRGTGTYWREQLGDFAAWCRTYAYLANAATYNSAPRGPSRNLSVR